MGQNGGTTRVVRQRTQHAELLSVAEAADARRFARGVGTHKARDGNDLMLHSVDTCQGHVDTRKYGMG